MNSIASTQQKSESNKNSGKNLNKSSSQSSSVVVPFKIVENTKIWLSISGILILLSIIAIVMSCLQFGSPVKLGLDFVGGTKIEYKFQKINSELIPGTVREKVLDKINSKLGSDSIAQVANNDSLVLRTKVLSVDDRSKLDNLLRKSFGEFEILSVDTVSGSIGPELMKSGLLALLVALIGILLFVSFRFRRDFAICSIIALCHDVLIVVGLFAALGLFFGIEVNILFLTACLTVLGFSIHDTIVVFDRVRENSKLVSKKRSFSQVVNESIAQVWFRSLSTSFTVLITLGALLFFGGETTRIFAGAMFAGTVFGSYSSIFIASSLLGWWNSRKTAGK